MKAIYLVILAFSLFGLNASAQSDEICECYSKVKSSTASEENFLNCLEAHRKAVAKLNDSVMKMMRSGKMQGVEEIKQTAEHWKECFQPKMEEINSELTYQFKDHLGKEVELFFDVDFTAYNKFTKTGYLEIEFANYDRSSTWERPENAFVGSITIARNDSVADPSDFSPKTYSVKRSGEELEEYFYVDYNYLDYKHSGGYHKAQPRETSSLTIVENNGRYIQLELNHVSEEGDLLTATFQCVYPFTEF
ncbi:MAG: hypothetical protein HWE22_13615 [Flavobacteriales bacterium]|nr:hypothetical protein [Flavobacteriales bacterium]